ncbi:transposase [Microbacterium halophytorum]|uniref:transposase n=1 Tax=Microbacterium halophytorum TaxID=2067568 RepID=UPI00131A046A|nr:transposase [Microbacterium halophytorum]
MSESACRRGDFSAIGHAGDVSPTDFVRATGLHRALSKTLAPWRKPLSRHDPGKIILDAAIILALGGDALSDIAVLRAKTAVYSQVASDPTNSRTIAALAGDVSRVEAAVATARRSARQAAWVRDGEHAPGIARLPGEPVVVDLDATLTTAHSEKEDARSTFKRGFGFNPLIASVDHGQGGTGEKPAMRLRPGNAGSNTLDEHIDGAFAQLPGINPWRPGRSILDRADGAVGTKGFLARLTMRRVACCDVRAGC